MRVPTPIYLMLFGLVALAQMLAPTSASALINQTTGGACLPMSGGIYVDSTTGEFCNPNNGFDGYGEPGGSDVGAEPPLGGGGGPEPPPGGGNGGHEVITVQGEPLVDCGPPFNVYAPRKSECPPGDLSGCFSVDDPACTDRWHLPPSHPPTPPKTPKPQKTGDPANCQGLADDIQRLYRENPQIFDFMLEAGFTAEEIKAGAVKIDVTRASKSPTSPPTAIVLSSPRMTVSVKVGELHDPIFVFTKQVEDFKSKLTFMILQKNRLHCDKVTDPPGTHRK
jgi:hypothetical protein